MTYNHAKFQALTERKLAQAAALRELSERRQEARAHWQQLQSYLAGDSRHFHSDREIFHNGHRVNAAPRSRDEKIAAREKEIAEAEAEFRRLDAEYAAAAERFQRLAGLVDNLSDFLRSRNVRVPGGTVFGMVAQ